MVSATVEYLTNKGRVDPPMMALANLVDEYESVMAKIVKALLEPDVRRSLAYLILALHDIEDRVDPAIHNFQAAYVAGQEQEK